MRFSYTMFSFVGSICCCCCGGGCCCCWRIGLEKALLNPGEEGFEKYPDEFGDIIGDVEDDGEVLKNVGEDPSLALCWELLNNGLVDFEHEDDDDEKEDSWRWGGVGGFDL